jgi:hypothetical protein
MERKIIKTLTPANTSMANGGAVFRPPLAILVNLFFGARSDIFT